MNAQRTRRRRELEAEHERVQTELAALADERTALETELMRHDVYQRMKQAFPNATAGYPLYGR